MTLVALWASASMDEAPAMKFVWHALHAPAVFLPELSEIYQLAKWNECISSWELFNVYPKFTPKLLPWIGPTERRVNLPFQYACSTLTCPPDLGLRSILSRRTLWSPTPNSIMASRAPAMRHQEWKGWSLTGHDEPWSRSSPNTRASILHNAFRWLGKFDLPWKLAAYARHSDSIVVRHHCP